MLKQMTRLEQLFYDNQNKTPLSEVLSVRDKIRAVRSVGFVKVTADVSEQYQGQNYIPLSILDEMIERINPQPHHKIAVFDRYTKSILDLLGCKDVTLFDRGDGFLATSMKFDIVIGNPPYQDGDNKRFYREFVVKSFDVSRDVVAMITPANWASFADKDSKFLELIKSNGLESYKFLGRKMFDADIATVYFVCRKTNDSDKVTLHTQSTAIEVLLSDITYFPSTDVESFNIINKVLNKCQVGMIAKCGRLYRNKSRSDNPTVRCIWSAGGKDQDFEWSMIDHDHVVDGDVAGFGQHKVVMTGKYGMNRLGQLKYAGPEWTISFNSNYIQVDDATQAENLIAYLNSKIIRLLIMDFKSTAFSNSKSMFKSIPKLDMNRKWTDAELYAHFGLTQDEIDHIERTIK